MTVPLGTLTTALRIARVSAPELTNTPTAVTSLVAVPLLEVVLLVAISASLGGDELVVVAYAAILLAFGLTIISGTVGQVTRDRNIGVVYDTLSHRFFWPPYWLSKVVVAAVLGLVVAVVSCAVVFAIDAEHDVRQLVGALAMLPVVAVVASVAAIGIATLSVGFRDPYLLANIARGVLPITAGVVVPLSDYPELLAGIARLLPLSGTIEAMRAIALAQPWPSIGMLIARDGVVCGAWFLVGLLASGMVVRALRDGRRREEIW